MKKQLLLLLSLGIMAIGLTACDNNEEKTNISEQQTPKSQSVETQQNEIVEIKEESGEEKIVIEDNKEEEKKNDVKEDDVAGYTTIKFSDMYEVKGINKNVSTVLKNLNGKKVRIKGYPAVQSPLDESFVYLNNQPFVTCPFCTVGDTTKLEVIPIFMANKSKIKYTENALDVCGTLEIEAKVDSEGYTTQFRIYADKVEEVEDSQANKAVNEYYAHLSQAGMIYDIQTLQMNVEYATNPEYMKYYDEKLQNGTSTTLDKITVVKGIADEYLDFDSKYGNGFGSDYTYLIYIKECPDIVKSLEPEDARLKGLNDELVKLYNDEIKILEKYQNICYKIHALGDNVTEKDADGFIKELKALNSPNLKQYDAFTKWNNKLRE